ncbi:putative HD superfamily hydrolase involved in NAD metabolism [Salirhabdus euzebyi]|uniref:bis(5'-nucleosyl)-tetraphosphatase (symmetrical) n=1 Tax=Salirhabdus euzebyi TaxID=394506 RepID=A0A841Q7J0_9BACI|nr:bis(5'-nucleosyl)-tetraphosphatase (symmetrical) YqeK [Salirhabdus euzebyi]MBB6454345.1 putative HD superfamily hydrolase involved in NAD metabolism [Salirhabdus euzebyi]
MERSEALAKVKPHLKQERYEHTVRVVDTAVKLSELNGAEKEKVEIAAAFHDYAKYRDKEELERWILKETGLSKDLLQYHHELWHGPVGAYIVKLEYNITDKEILNAITFHTTGRKNMSLTEKIVFLADYIEPGRKFPGVEEVRDAAWKSLNLGCYMALKNTIQFLMSKKQPIYPDTFHAYNDFVTMEKK